MSTPVCASSVWLRRTGCIASVLVASVLGLTTSASALTIGSSYLIGSAVPGTPSGVAVEEDRLEYFIADYNNGAAPPPLPAPPINGGGVYTSLNGAAVPPPLLPLYDNAIDAETAQIGAAAASLNLDVTGWNYLMVKWANDSYYYYVGGLTGTHTFNSLSFNQGNGNPQNASHYRLFGAHERDPGNPVPDGGSMVLMLGSALGGLSLLRRRLA